jgi:hypothetical protein
MECIFDLEVEVRDMACRDLPVKRIVAKQSNGACEADVAYAADDDHFLEGAGFSISPPASSGPRKGLKKELPSGPAATLDASPGSSPVVHSPKPCLFGAELIVSDPAKAMGIYSVSQSNSVCTTIASSFGSTSGLTWPSERPSENDSVSTMPKEASSPSVHKSQSVLDESRCVVKLSRIVYL